MENRDELKIVIESIPNFSDYGEKSQLEICLPKNSTISWSKVLKIMHEEAAQKGWIPEHILVIQTGAYIICKECGNKLHVHVTTPEAHYCMNCGHDKNMIMSKPRVRVVETE